MPARFDLVGLVVSDLARSLAFYRLLGIDIPVDAEPHVEVTLPGGLRIAWDTEDTIRSFDPSWTDPGGARSHRISLAFACESPADVDATFAAVIAAGHHGHLDPFDAFWGQRFATVHDPDRNSVDLFAPL